MVAIAALQPQKSVGEDAAIEKGVEFCFDVIGQAVCGFRLNLGEGLVICYLANDQTRSIVTSPFFRARSDAALANLGRHIPQHIKFPSKH